MQFRTELSLLFWKYSRFFLLQRRNKLTKFWVSKTRDKFSQNITLDTQDAVLKNPPQNFQKIWNWLKTISKNFFPEVFPLDTCNSVSSNLRKKCHRKFKNLRLNSLKNYIFFRNHLFTPKQSIGHVDAVLSKLAKRYWKNPQVF